MLFIRKTPASFFCGVLLWVSFLLRSSLKMLHRSIFFTLGFKPLSAKQKNCTLSGASLERMTYAFYTENTCLVFCGVLLWVSFLLRSSLKMLHRSIFFTLGFEPLSANQKNAPFRVLFGADDGARTRYLHLGKVALYQMSYIRIFIFI